ncbi:MAG: ferrous iron transport protein A [Clostridia bacterium]|nr:ferrous iron transport protein A [Clostridia bacterium]
MKLTDLRQDAKGQITAVPFPRMAELGLVRGTTVRVLSKGMGGNPLQISFEGCRLLIDRRTARKTEVEPCD